MLDLKEGIFNRFNKEKGLLIRFLEGLYVEPEEREVFSVGLLEEQILDGRRDYSSVCL